MIIFDGMMSNMIINLKSESIDISLIVNYLFVIQNQTLSLFHKKYFCCSKKLID